MLLGYVEGFWGSNAEKSLPNEIFKEVSLCSETTGSLNPNTSSILQYCIIFWDTVVWILSCVVLRKIGHYTKIESQVFKSPAKEKPPLVRYVDEALHTFVQ